MATGTNTGTSSDHEHDHGAMITMAADPTARAGQDLNLMAAYTHVIADALTSVLAIVALTGGKLWNWSWLDPAMGIVGALVVGAWAFGSDQEHREGSAGSRAGRHAGEPDPRWRWNPTATRG